MHYTNCFANYKYTDAPSIIYFDNTTDETVNSLLKSMTVTLI